jgi:hypothetical protein
MPIHVRENLYQGVNAHLQSALQSQPSRWLGFHDAFILNLTKAVSDLLPPGYHAINRRGLQTIEDDDYVQAVVIYHQHEPGKIVPIVHVELLVPASKPPGPYHEEYVARRRLLLESGHVLVEIDFLHEQQPNLKSIPSYPDQDPQATPYLIVVIDARPSIDEGLAQVYAFRVDETFPHIKIPLAADLIVQVDFGQVYNLTYESPPYYGKVMVDYAHDPVRIEMYTPADQERIRTRMRLIAEGQGKL